MHRQQQRPRSRLRPRYSRIVAGAIAPTIALTLTPLTFGADDYWNTAVTNGYWDVAANWSPTGPPQDGDNAYVTAASGTYTLLYRNSLSPPPRVALAMTATGSASLTMLQAQDTFNATTETIDGRGGTSALYVQSGGVNTLTADLDLGNYADSTGMYQLNGGSLASRYQYVGNQGVGTFTQTSGTNTASNISLGGVAGAIGTYTISGGSVSSFDEFIGSSGVGDFHQEGGTNTFTNGLRLAVAVGSRGSYEFTAGQITGIFTRVGEVGPGTFLQTGGMQTLSASLQVGASAGESSSYTLSNDGALVAHDEFIADSGTGTFTQDGGSNSVIGQLLIGKTVGDGTYALQAGTLSAFDLAVAPGGTGRFIQSAGKCAVGHLLTVDGDPASGRHGSFELHDGSVTAPALLNSDTFIQTGGTATFGPVTGTGTLTVTGGTFTATNVAQGTLSIGGTGRVTLTAAAQANAPASVVSSLHFDAGSQAGSYAGSLDLTNNALLINYGSGASPDADVRAYLVSGMHAFDHAGITSTAATANPTRYTLGYADGVDGVVQGLAAGQELVKFALVGDVTLDGSVGFGDLLALAQHYGISSGARWDEGDLNYDGRVDFGDLLLLAQHYGQAVSATPAAISPVPEPLVIPAVAGAAVLLLRRRRGMARRRASV